MNPFVITNAREIEGRLLSYLRKELDDAGVVYELPLTKLLGGAETLTFQFQLKTRQAAINKPLVLRIYPDYVDPRSALLDSCVHGVLADAGYPVPKAHFASADKSILGGAFFIMDFLPGTVLSDAPAEIRLKILGETHATLHKIDPRPLTKALAEQGIDENQYSAAFFLQPIADLPKEIHFLRDTLNWVLENRKAEKETLAICHGDFHTHNILIKDGQVSGILDWHLSISDPAYDIARTIQVLSVFSKVYVPDWALLEKNTQQYLDAYQTILPLNHSNIMFGRVVYSIFCLMAGASGHQFLRDPVIVNDQIDLIHKVTGIRLPMPDWVNKNTEPIE